VIESTTSLGDGSIYDNEFFVDEISLEVRYGLSLDSIIAVSNSISFPPLASVSDDEFTLDSYTLISRNFSVKILTIFLSITI